MNIYLFAAVILLLPALCTALGAAGVFLVRRADEPRTRRMLCGMAAGIMLAASVWSLLLPAIERAEAGILPVWLAPAAGLVLGAVGLLRLEESAGRLMHTGSKEHGRMGRVVLAVTLHNLPEGMVVGLAAALALQGEPEAPAEAETPENAEDTTPEPDDLDGWRQWLDTHPEPNDQKGDPPHAEL